MIVWEDYCEEWKKPYCLIIGLYWTQNKNLKFWVVVVVVHGLTKADVWLGRICFKPCQCALIVPCSVDIRILILILRGKIYLSFLFSFSFSGDQKFSRNPFQGYLEECAGAHPPPPQLLFLLSLCGWKDHCNLLLLIPQGQWESVWVSRLPLWHVLAAVLLRPWEAFEYRHRTMGSGDRRNLQEVPIQINSSRLQVGGV